MPTIWLWGNMCGLKMNMENIWMVGTFMKDDKNENFSRLLEI